MKNGSVMGAEMELREMGVIALDEALAFLALVAVKDGAPAGRA